MSTKLTVIALVLILSFSVLGCAGNTIMANSSIPSTGLTLTVVPLIPNPDPTEITPSGTSTTPVADTPKVVVNAPASSMASAAATGPVAYVTITSTGFVPDTLTVTAGTTVVWLNPDHLYHHNITSMGHLYFGEQNVDIDIPYYSFEFDSAGTYPYMDLQFNFMATIIVQ